MSNLKKLFNFKFILIVVTITFILNNAVYSMAISQLRNPLFMNTKDGQLKFKILEFKKIIDSSVGVVNIEHSREKPTLKEKVSYFKGKLLLDEEAYRKYNAEHAEQQLQALQSIINKIISLLMLIIKEEEPIRYSKIEELISERLKTLYMDATRSSYISPSVSAILALVFEYKLMNIPPEDIKDECLRNFLIEGNEVISMISGLKYKLLFGEEFDVLSNALERLKDPFKERALSNNEYLEIAPKLDLTKDKLLRDILFLVIFTQTAYLDTREIIYLKRLTKLDIAKQLGVNSSTIARHLEGIVAIHYKGEEYPIEILIPGRQYAYIQARDILDEMIEKGETPDKMTKATRNAIKERFAARLDKKIPNRTGNSYIEECRKARKDL